MKDTERRLLAARLREEQRRRFGSRKNAAYKSAGVNAATWENAINGKSMKDWTIHDIVVNLWPETEGDWRQIPGLEAPGPDYDHILVALDQANLPSTQYEAIRSVIEAQKARGVQRGNGDTTPAERYAAGYQSVEKPEPPDPGDTETA